MDISSRLSLEEFNEIYSKVPRLTVEVIVRTPAGVLLTRRAIEPYKGQWHIPGGTVLYKESITDAVHRVADDELGLHVSIERMLGYIEYPSEEQKRGFGWTIGLAFLCTSTGGELRGSPQGEIIEAFSSLPADLISEQKEFLAAHLSL